MLIQYHGNDLDVLRQRACALLASDPPPPLHAELIVVPNAGMGRWMRQGIAAALGAVVAVECVSPAAFTSRLAQRLLSAPLGRVADPYAKESLAWSLMAILPGLLDRPGFEPLHHYLDADRSQLRVFGLCQKLAELFDQYLYFRPDWLLAWERDEHADPAAAHGQLWQVELWKALVADIGSRQPEAVHGAQRGQRLNQLIGSGRAASVLPSRVIVFGLTAISPGLLELIRLLGRGVDIHLFHFNPCAVMWDDIVDERTMARWIRESPERAVLSDVGHPLLASWGKLGRDSLRLLLELSDADVEDCFVDSAATGVLGEIQRDILELQCPDPSAPRALDAKDDSIVFAQAAGPLREVEALHDHLLHLFETRPGLEPRDILIMAPDVDIYAPYITAVFNESRATPRFIPFTIADRPELSANPLLQALVELLGLPDSDLAVSDVLRWLAVPAIAGRFEIRSADADVAAWVLASGARRGYAPGDGAAAPANTWTAGLRRLLLGVALDEREVWEGLTPVAPAGSNEAVEIGQLAAFVERLQFYRDSLRDARDAMAWSATVNELIDCFVDQSAADVEVALAPLRQVLVELPDTIREAGFDAKLERNVLISVIGSQLDSAEGGHRFLRGAATVSTLTPLRSIPHRIVCVLGLNADAYPRVQRPPAFDLMAREPRIGDRSRRDDDRQLFLEALLSARDCLYLSRIGTDERDNTRREASALVNELREHIDRFWRCDAGRPGDQLSREHPLKPFDRRYFDGNSRLFSYRGDWCLPAGDQRREPAFEALPPLDDADQAQWQSVLGVLRHPCRGFFSYRLGAYFGRGGESAADLEPLSIDGLTSWRLRDELLQAVLDGGDAGSVQAVARARGELPHGHVGNRMYQRRLADTEALSARLAPWAATEPASYPIDIQLESARLIGTLGNVRGSRVLLWTASEMSAAHLIEFWLHHLVACRLGVVTDESAFYSRKRDASLTVLSQDEAGAELQRWLGLHAEALRRPLPLFPKASLAYATRLQKSPDDRDAALAAARNAFEGSMYSSGDAGDASVERVWRTIDAAIGDEFESLARVWVLPILARLGKAASLPGGLS